MSIENTVEQPIEKSYGLIIVKPDAIDLGLEHFVDGILNGNNEEVLNDLQISHDNIEKLKNLRLVKQFYRDISHEPYDTKEVLDIFYRSFKDKRQYPIFMDVYNGPLIFLLVESDMPKAELDETLKAFKGLPQQLDAQGDTVIPPTGFRGKFMKPIRYYTKSEYKQMTEDEYRTNVPEIMTNMLHTTDSDAETAEALYRLLPSYELDELESRGVKIRDFIDQHYPRSLSLEFHEQ